MTAPRRHRRPPPKVSGAAQRRPGSLPAWQSWKYDEQHLDWRGLWADNVQRHHIFRLWARLQYSVWHGYARDLFRHIQRQEQSQCDEFLRWCYLRGHLQHRLRSAGIAGCGSRHIRGPRRFESQPGTNRLNHDLAGRRDHGAHLTRVFSRRHGSTTGQQQKHLQRDGHVHRCHLRARQWHRHHRCGVLRRGHPPGVGHGTDCGEIRRFHLCRPEISLISQPR